jgi:hypothetical protein
VASINRKRFKKRIVEMLGLQDEDADEQTDTPNLLSSHTDLNPKGVATNFAFMGTSTNGEQQGTQPKAETEAVLGERPWR